MYSSIRNASVDHSGEDHAELLLMDLEILYSPSVPRKENYLTTSILLSGAHHNRANPVHIGCLSSGGHVLAPLPIGVQFTDSPLPSRPQLDTYLDPMAR